MNTTIHKLHLSLLLSIILFIFGCTSFENEPKPISSSEVTVDIDVGEVIRSGEFEERVETEQIPQNNCQGKSAFFFSVSRERTLEQSVDLVFKGEGGGELEIAGKPMDVGAAGKIIAAIGAEYGQSSRKSISDRGGMEFTIEAGDFPTYIIVWREKWEKGYVTIQHNNEVLQVPYLYLTTARPELVNVEYKDCATGEPLQEKTQETDSSENVSTPTNTPIPLPTATSAPIPPPPPTSTPVPPPPSTFTPTPPVVVCSGAVTLGPWPPVNGQGQDIFIDSGDGFVHADFWRPGGTIKAGYDETSVIIEPGTKITVVGVSGQGWKYGSGCSKEYVEAQVAAHQDRRQQAGKNMITISVDELCAVVGCR